MRLVRVILAVAALGALRMQAADAQATPDGPDPPAALTTDTPAYCSQLASRMDQETDASFDAIAMGNQGKELCARGEVRAGIARLRRALMEAEAQEFNGGVSYSAGVDARPSGTGDPAPGDPDDNRVTFPDPPGHFGGGAPMGGPPRGH